MNLPTALILLALPAAAQTVVVDGDTLKLNGTTYRLWGIDAPESKQHCGPFPAGEIATGALRNLTAGKVVACEHRTTDRYGRRVALCRADGRDLGADMVRAGMALAFVRYSRDYVDQESAARAERRGVHDHDCVPAWEHRARERGGR